MALSETQQEIFDYYKSGQNVFVTGPGGCGKSYLLKHIIRDAYEQNKKISICAMTGCAAILLGCGAKTVHSWAGIGIAKGEDDVIITRIMTNKYKKQSWKSTQILILDEVSMMSKRMFELLDQIGKRVRNSSKPFGGIQLVFSGDFYQLPPVNKHIRNVDETSFCFESPLWSETFDAQVLLDEVFRQTDKTYINVLHQIRTGKLYKEDVLLLRTRLIKNLGINDKNIIHNGVKPVKLLPTKSKAQQINNFEITNIQNDEIRLVYKTKYEPSEEIIAHPSYKRPTTKQLEMEETFIVGNSLFDKELTLKKGAQVMCIANIDLESGICNGSTGIIIDFRVDNTSTKSQHPIVKFSNGITRLIEPHVWASDNYPGFKISQYPLILAWAVTIHKSQGATLESAEIDIGSSVFAPGQTYVALSRVKSLDGLYLRSFNHTKIKTVQKVNDFYEQFYE
jgi:ATP-dependent DNA helicase PIF1